MTHHSTTHMKKETGSKTHIGTMYHCVIIRGNRFIKFNQNVKLFQKRGLRLLQIIIFFTEAVLFEIGLKNLEKIPFK